MSSGVTLGEKTRLVKASSKFESLRATVPKSIVTFMKLKEGDFIDWDLQVLNGKMTLIVSKVNNKK
jgi:hypothetical protein